MQVKNEVSVGLYGLSWKYDLQGAVLTSMMVNWSPYLNFVGDCKAQGYMDCPYKGIMLDVAKSLQKSFNFTLRMDKEPSTFFTSDTLVIITLFLLLM